MNDTRTWNMIRAKQTSKQDEKKKNSISEKKNLDHIQLNMEHGTRAHESIWDFQVLAHQISKTEGKTWNCQHFKDSS